MKSGIYPGRLGLIVVVGLVALGATAGLMTQVAAADAAHGIPAETATVMAPLALPGEAQPALVLLAAADPARLKVARAYVEAQGGRVTHLFPPGAFIVEALPETAAAWSGQAGIAAVRFDSVAAQQFEAWAAPAIAVWNRNYHGVGAPKTTVATPTGPFEEPARKSLPPELLDQLETGGQPLALPYGGSMYDTSEYMVGDVAVVLILPESNGISETKAYTWTADQVVTIQADVQSGLSKYVPYDPNAHVTFLYEFPSAPPPGGVTGTVACNYEAVTHASTCLAEAVQRLGYANIYAYLNAVRDAYGTQWVYAIEGVNGYLRAYASIGGPTTVISLNDLRSGYVIHHETAHIFGADDEYCPDACESPIGRSGYLKVVNANSQGPSTGGPGYFAGKGESIPGIMISSFGDVNPYARGGLGWRDRDADGVLDVWDTFPETRLLTPTLGPRIQYLGFANVTPDRVSTYGVGGVTVDTLAAVEYRVNGGAWQPAQAADGVFDEAAEDFSVLTGPLPNGVYQLEARALNQVGNSEQRWASVVVTVSGSAATNAAPFAVLTLTPAEAVYTTSIQFDARATTDLEGNALTFCWDWDGVAPCDTGYTAVPTATHVYAAPGLITPHVYVQDTLGNTAIATATLQLASTNTSPVARFSADASVRWSTTSPTFTFDARATRDGETPADLVQVRWDWDGNGIYDTAYTTTKVISHTYTLTAQGRPDGLPRSNEFLVNLQARDAAGQTSLASLVVWGNPYNHPPSVSIGGPSVWHTATAVPLNAIAADADFTTTWDGLLEARWDWDADGNWDTPFTTANLTPSLTLTQTGRYTLTVEAQDRFGASALASTTVDILPPPRLALASSVSLTVPQNTVAVFPLPLGNIGGLPLTYTLTVADPQSVTYSLQDSLATPGLYAWNSVYPGAVSPGYIATAPPRLETDEGHSGQLPLNFDFPFFGRVYTQVYGVTNGYLTFLPPYGDLGVGTLPTGSVSLLWADYDLSRGEPGNPVGGSGGGMWQYNNSPNRGHFLFEYDGVVRAGFTYTDARTFQGALYPDGSIKVQYSWLMSNTASLPAALRSPAGGAVIAYSGVVTAPLAVLFRPVYGPVNWLTVSPLNGARAVSTTAPLSLTVNTAGLAEGDYTAWLLVQTNDPYNLYRIVPVYLRVTRSSLPTVSKTVSHLNPAAGERVTYTVRINNPGPVITEAVVADALPVGVVLAGPVTLSGGTGVIGAPPNLVTNLTLPAGGSITVTYPVTVTALSGTIVNTVQLSGFDLPGNLTASATFWVKLKLLYLPLVRKE